MQVQGAMTSALRNVTPASSLTEVARIMRADNVGCVPVCEGDRVLGIITDRDLAVRCMAEGLNPNDCKAGDFMSREVVAVSPQTSVEEALNIMGQRQIRRLPVLEDNRLVGLISLGDLAVESNLPQAVVATLISISQPIHQTEGGRPRAAAA